MDEEVKETPLEPATPEVAQEPVVETENPVV